jgi:hypothetical protein
MAANVSIGAARKAPTEAARAGGIRQVPLRYRVKVPGSHSSLRRIGVVRDIHQLPNL